MTVDYYFNENKKSADEVITNQVTVSAPRSNDVNINVYLLHNIFVTYKR